MGSIELALATLEVVEARPNSLAETLRLYDQSIGEEAARMKALIADIDSRRAPGQHIVSFADSHRPEDYVARYQAMVKVFGMFGLTDAYYYPQDHPGLANETENSNGWDLDLMRPDKRGIFHIVFSRLAANFGEKRPTNRQTVYYKRGRR